MPICRRKRCRTGRRPASSSPRTASNRSARCLLRRHRSTYSGLLSEEIYAGFRVLQFTGRYQVAREDIEKACGKGMGLVGCELNRQWQGVTLVGHWAVVAERASLETSAFRMNDIGGPTLHLFNIASRRRRTSGYETCQMANYLHSNPRKKLQVNVQ